MRSAPPLLLALVACLVPIHAGCATRDADTRPLPTLEPLRIGTSVQGRPIVLHRTGSGPLRTLLIAHIHGNEPEGTERFDELWASLQTPAIRRASTLHAIPTMNPDGLVARTRGNARGVDLNRNWPASNFSPHASRGPAPLSEPEAAAVHRHIERFAPDLVIVLHSVSSGPFVDPDGPADDAALAFVDATARLDARWRFVRDFTNPPGSLGTYLGKDRQIGVLTVEFARGQDPVEARAAATAGITAAIDALAKPTGR